MKTFMLPAMLAIMLFLGCGAEDLQRDLIGLAFGVSQPQAVDGKDGTDGRDGDQGIPGLAGLDGDRGADGRDGDTGPTGPAGPAGPSGPIGPAGLGPDACTTLCHNGSTLTVAAPAVWPHLLHGDTCGECDDD